MNNRFSPPQPWWLVNDGVEQRKEARAREAAQRELRAMAPVKLEWVNNCRDRKCTCCSCVMRRRAMAVIP